MFCLLHASGESDYIYYVFIGQSTHPVTAGPRVPRSENSPK